MNNTAIKIPDNLEYLVDKINDYKGSNRCDWAPGDYEITDCSKVQLVHMRNKLIWMKDQVDFKDYSILFTLINKTIKRRI